MVELLLSRARLLFDPRGKVNTFLLESTTFKDQNVALRFGIYIIYLKRPTNLNKGFDFEVRVSNMRFKHINKNGRISYSNRPSHDNIIDDLAEKKAEDSSQFTLLLTVIDAIFNCVEIDPQIYCKFSFRSGYPVDMICKCIKWLFIEQDITYWNWSGRNMLYNGIKNV